MKSKIGLRGGLNRAFLALYFAAAACILAATSVVSLNWGSAVFAVLFAAGWAAFQLWGRASLERLGARRINLLVYLLTAGMLALQLSLALRYEGSLHGDPEAIYTGVKEAVDTGSLNLSNPYFLRYRHQRGMLMVLSLYNYVLQRLGLIVTTSIRVNLLLVCACVSGAVLFTYHAAKRLYGAPRAFGAMLFVFTFLPFYTYVIVCYSNTVGIVFLAFAVWAYVFGLTAEKRAGKAAFLAAAGAGFAMSSTVLGVTNIVIVAVLLHLFLTNGFKAFLKRAAVLAFGFALLSAGFQYVLRSSGIMDFTDEDKELFPVTYWIMVALENDGMYNEEDYARMVEIGDYGARVEYTAKEIGVRLAKKTPAELAAHQWRKTKMAWGHQDYVTGGSPALRQLCRGRFLFMAALFLVSGAAAFKRGKPGWHTLFQLVIFGTFLFFQIWEVKVDNMFGLMPLFCLGIPAMDGTLLPPGGLAEAKKS